MSWGYGGQHEYLSSGLSNDSYRSCGVVNHYLFRSVGLGSAWVLRIPRVNSRRLNAMYNRAFERAFLEYRSQGLSESWAIDLAERDAQDGLDRYCDDRLEEFKSEEE